MNKSNIELTDFVKKIKIKMKTLNRQYSQHTAVNNSCFRCIDFL